MDASCGPCGPKLDCGPKLVDPVDPSWWTQVGGPCGPKFGGPKLVDPVDPSWWTQVGGPCGPGGPKLLVDPSLWTLWTQVGGPCGPVDPSWWTLWTQVCGPSWWTPWTQVGETRWTQVGGANLTPHRCGQVHGHQCCTLRGQGFRSIYIFLNFKKLLILFSRPQPNPTTKSPNQNPNPSLGRAEWVCVAEKRVGRGIHIKHRRHLPSCAVFPTNQPRSTPNLDAESVFRARHMKTLGLGAPERLVRELGPACKDYSTLKM